MKLFDKNIKLAIFDLDGTLIDSTGLWKEIDRKFFNMHGMDIPPNYSEEIAHLGLYNTAKYTKEKYNIKESVEEIISIWHEMALEAYQNEIPLKEGALELLNLLKENDVKIALATANNEELYVPCLKRLNVKDYFDYIVDVTKCKNGKNSPEIYQKAADLFKVEPNETIVLEDILQSQITAYNAGFIVVGVFDKNSTSDLKESKKYSHFYITNFKELIDFIISTKH